MWAADELEVGEGEGRQITFLRFRHARIRCIHECIKDECIKDKRRV